MANRLPKRANARPARPLLVPSGSHSGSEVSMRASQNSAASDAYIAQDAQLCITEWSAEAEQLFGWTCAEALGKRSHLLVPPRNREVHDSSLLSALDWAA